MNSLPKARYTEIVVQETKNETLIYDLKINRIHSLNETLKFVWQNCDGQKSAAEISILIGREFSTKVDEDFVWLALESLQKENLLEDKLEIPPKFTTLSRRELIKKAGLATMLALPMATSFFAPTAANAQSVGSAVCTINAPGCQPTNNADLFVYTFNNSPTPFCQFGDPNCQSICDAAINQCCSCNTVLLPDTINAAFVCRCV